MSDNDEGSPETFDYRSVICPHCGYKHGDAWEMTGNDEEEHETECAKCEKPFVCWASVSISYSARPLKREERYER